MENEKQQEEVVEHKVSEDVKSEETKVETPSNKNEDGDYKVDLSKPAPKPTEEKVEEKVTPVEKTEVKDTPEQEEESIIQEVTGEVEETEDVLSKVDKQQADKLDEEEPKQETPEVELPENVQELVKFMNETGGTLEDYVRLNADYSNIDNEALLREYYKSTKPHLSTEEVNFMLEDNFSYDDEADDPRDIKRKQLAHKEAVAQARNHLDGLKAQYYKELKLGSKLAPEQQKAIDFFNRYNKESEEAAKVAERQTSKFKQESAKVFNEKFEGFDYSVGDKKYRFKVNNTGEVKETQSDINNFIKKFLNEKGEMKDAKGYHKSLFTAMNADQVAQHFYEQGKADAVKDSMARTKNVNMNPRGVHEEVTTSNGWKIRAVDSGESSSKLKVKFKK